jgi:SAM-dependent methyltransferase
MNILARPEGPVYYDSNEVFEKLQTGYPPYPDYGYGIYGNWNRGVSRTLDLLNRLEMLRKPDLSVLEAGCGDGMTGYAFASYGHNVKLVDIEDWRDTRAKNIPFVCGNLCEKLPIDSDNFDLVCSFNTFEHLDDPKATLNELIRVCKRNGYLYLSFGPLYPGPWGLHAYGTLRMPYPQFLFSKSFLDEKLKILGIYDLGKKLNSLQPLNKWRPNQFSRLWQQSECKLVSSSFITDLKQLDIIRQFPKAFTGRGLTFEDVTIHVLSVIIKKK